MRPSAWAAWQLATPRDFCSRVESLGVVAVGPPSLPAVGLRRRQRSRRRFALFAGARGRKSVLADPLATVPAPVVPNCDLTTRYNRTVTIDPGVYCGGISILNNSVVTFRPGIYFVKDGKFFVYSNTKVQGDGVGFYLTGNNATLHFTSNTRIDFTAPSTGALAGILFFEDRSAPVERLHYFDSNSITRETGSMYLSRGIFSTDSNSTIAANSAFTNVIARKVWIKSNASLTLNADYGATTVPNVAVYYEGVEAVWLVK